ncbi:NAD(P)H-dependent oxidoreductase [Bradyrhizobium jicamae]|uniref:NADPH-dependent FMN reductase n=1 Tax=Bradyrhizobium jicamae TaxID=280332 RepID=UPI001BABA852|nr:NAD(P)H-dependent oxidoreductase [Bradyrhizobium jicamae]MBR0751254.1 NAD(P)H-dependent oxidoreductase [Bradyrhizobium jicamae]
MSQSVLVLVGSARKTSINLKLARALVRLAPQGLQFDFAALHDLPLFNQDHEQDMPSEVLRVRRQIEAARGLLFVTPEHNRSIPSLLKNVIDWASRPYGRSLWSRKPAAIAGASVGAIGTAVAQAHLRSMLGYLDVPTLGQPEVCLRVTEGLISDEGEIENEGTRAFLQSFMAKYAEWVAGFERSRLAS